MIRRWTVAVVAMAAVCVLLAAALSSTAVSTTIFVASTTTSAVVWTIAAATIAPLRVGTFPAYRPTRVRAAALGLGTGVLLGAIFAIGALIARCIPVLRETVSAVTAHAQHGPLVLVVALTLVNGVGEELFFRGALYELCARHHPASATTAAYTLVTAATGNLMLAFAALVLGATCALLRRATGGLIAPIITHITWSALMLTALPRLF